MRSFEYFYSRNLQCRPTFFYEVGVCASFNHGIYLTIIRVWRCNPPFSSEQFNVAFAGPVGNRGLRKRFHRFAISHFTGRKLEVEIESVENVPVEKHHRNYSSIRTYWNAPFVSHQSK
jgi:hypothetical protein